MPTLYIIAGPNGAGKTTTSQTFLPENLNIVEFVNADNIAKGLSPFNSEGVAFEAGRIMINRIRELAAQKKDFAIETTLSSLSYIKFIRDCKANGYEIMLIFVWLKDVDLAKVRVQQRVAKGGHNIPADVIERRYYKGIHNLRKYFVNLCNSWLVINNSDNAVSFVASFEKSGLTIYDNQLYKLILDK